MMRIEYDDSRLRARLKEFEQKLSDGVRKTSKFMAQLGVAKASVLAPKDTGKTAEAIYARPIELSKTRSKWAITAPEQYPAPIIKWMHNDNTKTVQHWKKWPEERRKFMYTTKKYLNDIKSGVAKGRWRNIKV